MLAASVHIHYFAFAKHASDSVPLSFFFVIIGAIMGMGDKMQTSTQKREKCEFSSSFCAQCSVFRTTVKHFGLQVSLAVAPSKSRESSPPHNQE